MNNFMFTSFSVAIMLIGLIISLYVFINVLFILEEKFGQVASNIFSLLTLVLVITSFIQFT